MRNVCRHSITLCLAAEHTTTSSGFPEALATWREPTMSRAAAALDRHSLEWLCPMRSKPAHHRNVWRRSRSRARRSHLPAPVACGHGIDWFVCRWRRPYRTLSGAKQWRGRNELDAVARIVRRPERFSCLIHSSGDRLYGSVSTSMLMRRRNSWLRCASPRSNQISIRNKGVRLPFRQAQHVFPPRVAENQNAVEVDDQRLGNAAHDYLPPPTPMSRIPTSTVAMPPYCQALSRSLKSHALVSISSRKLEPASTG